MSDHVDDYPRSGAGDALTPEGRAGEQAAARAIDATRQFLALREPPDVAGAVMRRIEALPASPLTPRRPAADAAQPDCGALGAATHFRFARRIRVCGSGGVCGAPVGRRREMAGAHCRRRADIEPIRAMCSSSSGWNRCRPIVCSSPGASRTGSRPTRCTRRRRPVDDYGAARGGRPRLFVRCRWPSSG
jgi:hypothetical protein